MHLQAPSGALVAEVQPNSPAAAAGVQPGDVISKIGGQAVQDPRELARVVAGLSSGTDQQMTVRRDGQDKTLTVAVASQPDQDGQAQASATDHGPRLGLALAPLDQQARQALNLPEEQKGVVIAQVKQGSPADLAGLQAGDVLEAVGDQSVSSPRQAVTALRNGTGKAGAAIALRVLRDGHQAFVALSAKSANEG
jgi:serine protease Do